MAIHAKQLQSLVDNGRLMAAHASDSVDLYAEQFPNSVASAFAIDDVVKRRALCRLLCEHGTRNIDAIVAKTCDTFTRLEVQMFARWWEQWCDSSIVLYSEPVPPVGGTASVQTE